MTRRTVLGATGATLAAALAGCSGGSASGTDGEDGTETDEPASSGGDGDDFGGWMEDVSNFDGVVDETGKSKVTVTVGAKGNGGAYAFDPPAVRVSSGTTVVWEWNGEGGSHNVVADDGSFESDLHGDAGATFEQTFDASGTHKYYCNPHKAMGMKGVVVVE